MRIFLFLFLNSYFKGPQVDWDPDIVAALDNDGDCSESNDELLEDDFILQVR